MSDDKIRCTLVYRLDSGVGSTPGVTCLAKYDFISDYEAHDGAVTEGALYAGRGNYGDAVSMVLKSDPPGAPSGVGSIGGFKVVQSDQHQVVYGGDSDGLCFAVVTGLRYPSRVATQMLTEIYEEFSKTLGEKAASAAPNSMNKSSKSILSKYCQKYEDVRNVDKASSLMDKVEIVKGQMQDNIASMLQNMEKTEAISTQADQLNEQASVFKKKSNDLRRQMKWKNMKMTAIIVLLIVGILLVILIPLIKKAKKSEE
jgi:vesicle-associated membrane protein 7